jgi:uncharacterized protein
MIKRKDEYLFGMSAAKNHITLAPWGGVLGDFHDRLSEYKVNKKTFQVPNDWKVDRKLLKDMIKASIATN